jgi:hypothetical protein
MKKVKIKENSWIARIAARRMKFPRIAIVLGRTIHLHNATLTTFINSRRWVLHELKHVEQFERGFLLFAWQYLADYAKNGYYQNKFEIEARAAEADDSLLNKYDLSAYITK